MRGAKSANSVLFKDFCNEAEMKKNKAGCVIYFVIVPKACIQIIIPQTEVYCFESGNILKKGSRPFPGRIQHKTYEVISVLLTTNIFDAIYRGCSLAGKSRYK
jgi:hypothetical protein